MRREEYTDRNLSWNYIRVITCGDPRRVVRYHARMDAQENATFGEALKKALTEARMSQADLARRLHVDPGQVSRWARAKAVPHIDTVGRIEDELGVDLSKPFEASSPDIKLYVSAPITGLTPSQIPAHHDQVAAVVEAARGHANSLYWPGEPIRSSSDLTATDIATERNMEALSHCTAFLFLQFDEIVRPSGALVELGLALGRRMKTTVIHLESVPVATMLDGFSGVASRVRFLPKARIYHVESVEQAVDLVRRNGRELLGLT